MPKDVGRTEKNPWADRRIGVNWASTAASIGTTVDQSAWAVVSGDVTLSGQQLSGAETSVIVEGGADNSTHYIENRVTFTDGSSAVFTVVLDVRDYVPDA